MITTHIVYESVKEHRAKSSKCPFCRKPVRRSMTFEHTINPFNKNEDGSIRTYSEVLQRVNEEADKWIPDFTHDKCKN